MKTIQLGSVGKDVIQWQGILIRDGELFGAADGRFGEKTKIATIHWQADRNLTPDAVVGPATWLAAGPGDDAPPAPEKPQGEASGPMDVRSESVIKDLDPSVQQIFRDIGNDINALIAPKIWKWTSGRRWRPEQQKLWDAYQNGGPKAARPGSSFHETGFAADGTVFASDGHTPIYDGPEYAKVVAYIKSDARMHDHSGHAYGDDPHVMVWPPSLDDGRSETAVLHELFRRIENKLPVWT